MEKINEKRVFSQNGEDGVLESIFSVIGTTNKYYVEIGTEDGSQDNTRNLMVNHGFSGLLVDSHFENKEINLHKEFVDAENLGSLLNKYNVPKEFDLFSLDIDFNDWYVLKSFFDNGYKPNAIVVESNAKWSPDEDKVVIYSPNQRWDNSDYFGGSVLAFKNLCNKYGYSFVYLDNSGTNMFFVKKEKASLFQNADDVNALYIRPKYGDGGHPSDALKREFVKSVNLLKY